MSGNTTTITKTTYTEQTPRFTFTVRRLTEEKQQGNGLTVSAGAEVLVAIEYEDHRYFDGVTIHSHDLDALIEGLRRVRRHCAEVPSD